MIDPNDFDEQAAILRDDSHKICLALDEVARAIRRDDDPLPAFKTLNLQLSRLRDTASDIEDLIPPW